jgi:hypothetical protein
VARARSDDAVWLHADGLFRIRGRAAVARIEQGLARGRVKAQVGPQGAIAFAGIADDERDGVTDACVYRRIMATGSALSRHMIAKAEMLAGRTVNRQVVGQGVHSHDGGSTWHNKG